MKPKVLFWSIAVFALVIAALYAVKGSVGMALLLLLVSFCCMLNATRARKAPRATWTDMNYRRAE